MLGRSLRARNVVNSIAEMKKAKAKENALKFKEVADKVRFELIRPHHFNHMMDLYRGFTETEPLSIACGTTVENSRNAIEAWMQEVIGANSVHPISALLYDKEKNKPIGLRLYNIGYKDPKLRPFPVKECILSPQERLFFDLASETFDKFYQSYPEEQVLVKGELGYLDPAYRGADGGIWQVMVEYNVDFEEFAKATGANYIGAVCSAPATKKWFTRFGFRKEYEGSAAVENAKGEKVPLEHGELWLLVNELKGMASLDVYPHWKEMGLKTKPYDNV